MASKTAEQAEPKRIGRPPAKEGEGKTEAVLLKLTPAQRDKLRELGGQSWVRSKIDNARVQAAAKVTAKTARRRKKESE